MKKVGIIYWSKTGATEQLAAAIKDGLGPAAELELVIHAIKGNEIVEGRFINDPLLKELSQCNAIIFGTPTYMGGVAAQFKAFIDATSELWCEQAWAGKIAAGFTVGSAPNGDQASTLQSLITFANQQGMIWVGLDIAHGQDAKGFNPLGCQLGVTACTDDAQVKESELATARYLGARIAKIVEDGLYAS